MKELFTVLLVMLVTLVGCKSTSKPVREPAAISEQTPGNAAAQLPEVEGEFEMKGHFRHAPSGTHFPPALGVFARASGHRYSIAEDNFSFRYLPGGQHDGLKIDVYVYPRNDETSFVDAEQWLAYLGEKMAGVVGGMKHHYDDVLVVDVAGLSATTATGEMVWIGTEATLVDEGVPMTSWAYIAAHGGWFYKMRMSMESTRAEAGRKLQKHFFDRFNERIERK